MGAEFEDLPSSSIPPPPTPPPPPPPPPPEDQSAGPPLPSSTSADKDPSAPPFTARPPFDPSRMIGIIRRKALIKDLAAVYHAECLSYCQQLLELQKQTEEPFAEMKHQEDVRKVAMRPPKRSKKVR